MIQKNEQEKSSSARVKKKKDSSFWEDVAINVAIIAATSFVSGMASAAGASTYNRLSARRGVHQNDDSLHSNVVDLRSAI